MADDPKCERGGYLVGTAFPVPADRSVCYRGGSEWVGCNRIHCPSCGAWVRQVERRELGRAPRTREEREWLYENLETAGEPFLIANSQTGSEVTRVYACRCSIEECANRLAIEDLENAWCCTGHPP